MKARVVVLVLFSFRPVKTGRSPGESPRGRSEAFHYTFRCVMFSSKAMLVAPLRPVDADESPYRSANAFEFAGFTLQGDGWVHDAFFRTSICNAEKCCLCVRLGVMKFA